MNLFICFAITVAAVHFPSTVVAQNWECGTERYEYAPDKSDQFCVFRSVEWKKDKPEPDFPSSPASNVAFVNSNFTRLPDRFYEQFPQLEVLVIRNSTLQVLNIKNRLKIVYAEKNNITSVVVEGANPMLKELHIRENPLTKIDTIVRSLKALEVLDLSKTEVFSNDETIDLSVFASLPNLTELYLTNMQGYYVENEVEATLPKLKLLDLSGNPITPTNFKLRVFRTLPSLEELNLRDALMTDLSVSDIRHDFPALKRLYLDGNSFGCELVENLLEHFKARGVETSAQSRRCMLGFESIEGLCCKSYIKDVPKTDRPITTTTLPKDDGTTDTTRTKEPVVDKTVTNNAIYLYVGIAIAVLIGVAVIGFFIFKLTRKHQPVPTQDLPMPDRR